jgi:hypothetical protein
MCLGRRGGNILDGDFWDFEVLMCGIGRRC